MRSQSECHFMCDCGQPYKLPVILGAFICRKCGRRLHLDWAGEHEAAERDPSMPTERDLNPD